MSHDVSDPKEIQALARRIGEHLRAASGEDAAVREVIPLAGGACQDNLRVEVELGGTPQRLVLRSDAPNPLAGSLDRHAEHAVIGAAVAAGVTTPPARWPGVDLVRPGATAYFLDWRAGVAIGAKLVRDPGLADARARLPEVLAGELVKIHGITPSARPIPALGVADADPVRAALSSLRGSLDAGAPRPALELAFRWLTRAAPDPGPVTLVHGDYRTGNFLVTPAGLSAILDWEFAHWGSPAEDLAWLCVRDWRFGQLALPAGGFATRRAFLDAYAAAGGARFDPAVLHWWEVYGNARWAAGCLQQGRRYLSGERPDIEMIAIARRVVEMEYEALRLIEVGPAAPEGAPA